MKIQTLIGIDGYSLLVCSSGNLYSVSIIDKKTIVHSFEGIYPSLPRAIARGRGVIKNLERRQQPAH